MEAVKRDSQIIQVRLISKDWDKFNPNVLARLLSLDYASNQIGLVKAKKWVAKIFNVFEDEVNKLYSVYDDIGDAVYFLDVSKEKDCDYSLNQIISVLESSNFEAIKEVVLNLSALERKWFFRYLVKLPNNSIGKGTVKKIIAKQYKKKLNEVTTHCNFNTIDAVINYYAMGKDPPMNLTHGVFIAPMLAKTLPMKDWPKQQIIHYRYDGHRIQIHKQGESIILFDRMGNVINKKYPKIIEGIDYDIDNFILDGKIYPTDKYGSPLHSNTTDCDYALVIIDALKVDNVIIMQEPLSLRLTYIDGIVAKYSTDDALAYYNCALAEGFSGVIIKDSTKDYACSKREWINYSPKRMELDVVITGSNTTFTNFTVAVKSSNGFVNIGTINNGFSKEQLLKLSNQLRRLVEGLDTDYSFYPKVILTIKTNNIVRNNDGQLSLRHPYLIDIKDAYVQDINTIDDVLQMMVGL
jgi:DNA ligase 1